MSDCEVNRLLVVSSKARNEKEMARALLPDVTMVQYHYDTCTLDGILALVAQALHSTKVKSMAFVLHAVDNKICICGIGEKVLTMNTVTEQISIRNFLETIKCNHIDLESNEEPRMDLIGCPIGDTMNAKLICNEIQQKVFNNQVSIGFSSDLLGTGIALKDSERTVGELYFWKQAISSTLRFRSLHHSTNHYEKIRVVGKGAFGQAVLYRRKEDETLVVLKEVNMHDLNAHERQLALNEVSLLARLTHPNIITYYDSFEEDGMLIIEMEFADGGNLSQFLSRRERPLEEMEILIMFRQIVSAVAYLHKNGILHRDLKTANIFLMKDCTIKVGDFGISKAMGTQTQKKGAQTVLGTPYYISPEMCEGKLYGEKSDMWAIGCILYEMACLQKTFEGSNLPALVNKIMKGQYEQVRGNYSSDLKSVIRDLLRKSPEGRPDALELLEHRIPTMLDRYDVDIYDDGQNSSDEEVGRGTRRRTRSVLYSVCLTPFSVSPVSQLPSNIRIIAVSVSDTHQIVITSEKLAYAWGSNENGQLGVGDNSDRLYPCLVASLTGKAVTKTAVGNGFSLFCSENGIILSCGRKDRNGQENHEDDLTRPKLIDCLLSMDVTCMSCGPEHCMVVGEAGQLYVWGSGDSGRLGTSSEWDQIVPLAVNIAGITVANVTCGKDNSMVVTKAGSLYATGSNCHNKLNLGHRAGIIGRFKANSVVTIEKVLSFTLLKNIPGRAIDVSLGKRHSVVLLDTGLVVVFGCNEFGQLGRGHLEPVTSPCIVRQLQQKACVSLLRDKMVTFIRHFPKLALGAVFSSLGLNISHNKMAVCGEDFNLAGTTDNALYFWGRRSQGRDIIIHASTPPHSKEGSQFILDISTSSALRQTICLSLLVTFGNKAYLVVNTTVPLPHKDNRKSHDKTRGKMFRKSLRLAAPSQIRRTPSPGLWEQEKLDESLPESWIERELEEAELLPIQNQTPIPSDPGRQTSSDDGIQDSAEMLRLRKEKIESDRRLANLEEEHKKTIQMREDAQKRERDFLIQIASLTEQLKKKNDIPPVESPECGKLDTVAEDCISNGTRKEKSSRLCLIS